MMRRKLPRLPHEVRQKCIGSISICLHGTNTTDTYANHCNLIDYRLQLDDHVNASDMANFFNSETRLLNKYAHLHYPEDSEKGLIERQR